MDEACKRMSTSVFWLTQIAFLSFKKLRECKLKLAFNPLFNSPESNLKMLVQRCNIARFSTVRPIQQLQPLLHLFVTNSTLFRYVTHTFCHDRWRSGMTCGATIKADSNVSFVTSLISALFCRFLQDMTQIFCFCTTESVSKKSFLCFWFS